MLVEFKANGLEDFRLLLAYYYAQAPRNIERNFMNVDLYGPE
jgi:hypothetical protein